MIERRPYIPDERKRKIHLPDETMRQEKQPTNRFRAVKKFDTAMRTERGFLSELEEDIKAGEFLQGLLRFLDVEVQNDLYKYIKERNAKEILGIIRTIRMHFSVYDEALKLLSDEFFSDPEKVDWEEIERDFKHKS